MFLMDAWDNIVRWITWFCNHLAYELQIIARFLCFPSRTDEPPQGQSNHYLLILMKQLEASIEERKMMNGTPDWNTPSIWLDEDDNPAPYNDGIVAEYPIMKTWRHGR